MALPFSIPFIFSNMKPTQQQLDDPTAILPKNKEAHWVIL